MMQEEDENSPLLSGGRAASRTHSRNSSFSGSYSSSTGGYVNRFECKVCGQWGSIPAEHSGRVAKCENCGEGTPIRNPAAGKQYVRCVCHCLLVCPIDVNYLRCPRKTCRRIVEVRLDAPAQIEVNERFAVTSGEVRREEVHRCLNCGKFYDQSYHEQKTLCPHCYKAHRNKESRARFGCRVLIFLAVLFSIAFGVVVYFTRVYEVNHPVMLGTWIGLAFCAVVFLVGGLRCAHQLHNVSWPSAVER